MPSMLHVDIDAFYASVEQLDAPELVGRPVIVGGLGPRGVVAAASYEARPFGIHSALPMARARRLAPPDAVFCAPRFERYQEQSRKVMAILRSITPFVEPLASDEAFLDVSGVTKSQGPPPVVVGEIRRRVRDETGLTASVGAATTMFLAKLASELAKPDGVLIVEPGTELDLLRPLDIRRLWGVGPATHAKLERLGVGTIGELAALDREALTRALGPHRAEHLFALAHNRDDREVVPDREVKSIGHEETFPRDLHDRRRLEHELMRLADRVGSRLRRAAKTGRTVRLKVRYGNFRTISRSRTRRDPTDLSSEIATEARALLDSVDVGDGVRLLGISVTQLGALELQSELPFDGNRQRSALERTVDAVRERFGPDAVHPGAEP